MNRIASVICSFSLVSFVVVGCHGSSDRSPDQNARIVGRWESTETDPAKRTTWEFTRDGKVKASSDPEIEVGKFKFLNSDTIEIAWDNGMEKVTFEINVTKDEFELRAIAINLGGGKRPAKGPITKMKRANP
jgi:hypothetical protein